MSILGPLIRRMNERDESTLNRQREGCTHDIRWSHAARQSEEADCRVSASSESLPQESFEVFSAHVLVAYANDSIARSCKKRGTCAIVDLLSCSVVQTSLEFDHHAFAGTVK